jgi:hypothetical protein
LLLVLPTSPDVPATPRSRGVAIFLFFGSFEPITPGNRPGGFFGLPDFPETLMNTDSAEPAATTLEDFFGPAISSYTRAQALEDGDLVDVTQIAAEAGFAVSVALTRATWQDCVAWSDTDTARQTYQDVDGRLWDVVWMAADAVKRSPDTSDKEPLYFRLHRVPRRGRGRLPRLTMLKLLAGAGDEGEPVMTILLPNET